ncbi:interferon-induced protein 44-like [Odontesthes bonariensis]|uniref:interferon-induced protein 44-like n=1 Tax=Odontesthes bonariensis TaxID=219752 RepID=UPI003F58CE46
MKVKVKLKPIRGFILDWLCSLPILQEPGKDMGGNPSCFHKPWRALPESDQEMIKFLKSYLLLNKNTSHLRILLQGPVGAGKSSFINSVESAILGRIAGRVMTDATSGSSFTKKFKTFQICKDESRKTHCSFVFNDIMGFESAHGGIHVDDVKLILRGHVAEGHEFKADCPLSKGQGDYLSNPSLAEKVHVLVTVIPAAAVSLLTDDVIKKMRDVRLDASNLEIPQFLILTKVDEACPEVEKTITNIYKSKYLKEQVEKICLLLGIPMNSIFLVKNYNSEMETSKDMNVPLMYALRQMINFGEDFLNSQKGI